MPDEQYSNVGMEVETIVPQLNENDQQKNTDDESQICQVLQQLNVSEPVSSVQGNGSKKKLKKNHENQANAQRTPHQGQKRGKELDFIESNHLLVNFAEIVEHAFRYDVTIDTSAPKTLYAKVFSQFCAKYLPTDVSKQIAFDEDNMIALAPCMLNIGKRIYGEFNFVRLESENSWKRSKPSSNMQLNKNWYCTVKMRPAKKFAIPLKRILNGNDPQLRYEMIQALDIIMNSAYHQHHLDHGLRDHRSFYLKLNDQLPYLKEFYELRSGLYQRIILGEMEGSICPMLNVDVKHRAFPRAYTNLIDLLYDIQKEHTTSRFKLDLKEPLNSTLEEKLTAHLFGLEICYRFEQMNSGCLKFLGLGKKPAHEMKSKENGIGKTVQRYFDEHKLRIKYPQLKCIRMGCKKRFISVPMEYCAILGTQIVQQTFSEKQTKEMLRYTIMKPADRKEIIMHHLQTINHNQCETILAFGLTVADNFVRVPARQLLSPLLEYRDCKTIKPKNGEWQMNYGCDEIEVLSSASATTNVTWAILNTDSRLRDIKLKQFAKGLHLKSKKYGIQLNEHPNEIVFTEFDEIHRKLQKMADQNIDIVICVIPSENPHPMYIGIKIAGDLTVGIMTQCIKSNTFSDGTEFRENFLLNLNAKLDGVNQKLSTAPILEDFDTEPVMFIGAYVAPGQGNAPNIAGMVASYDRDAFCYNIGCPSQDKTITNFRSNFMENLKLFRQKNGCLPNKLIYFRQDESGNHRSDHTVASEQMAMLHACRDVEEGYEKIVKMTIIIVEKEQHMRLFTCPSAGNCDGNTNVPPGTIVDTTITQHEHLFYMVSQQTAEGVTKPTKYRIFLDQADHNIHDLQELIYFLCHMFARCNRSVSFPAPTHHARLMADRSKLYLT